MSDYLPQGFVSQILKYLPVKSLLRCRCVCKWWRQVIDSSNFTKEHLAVQNPRILVGYQDGPELFVVAPHTDTLKVDTLRVPIVHDIQRFKLIGSLHGVVCLFDNDSEVWLWNPSLRKVSRLPLPEYLFFGFIKRDWARRSLSTGFWINPSTKIFKFIIFDPFGDPVIYSSVERVWKKIPLTQTGNGDFELFGGGPPIVIGGVAYWRALYEFESDEARKVVVLSFDFVLETFDHFEVPPKHESIARLILEKWHDNLALAFEDIMIYFECNIYLRREGSWVHTFRFSLDGPDICRIIWVMAGAELRENIRVLATTTDDDLVLGDSRAGWIDVKNGIVDPFGLYVVYDFVESLLFP